MLATAGPCAYCQLTVTCTAVCAVLQHPSSYCCDQGRHPPLSPTLPGCTSKRCHVSQGLSLQLQTACIARPQTGASSCCRAVHACSTCKAAGRRMVISRAGSFDLQQLPSSQDACIWSIYSLQQYVSGLHGTVVHLEVSEEACRVVCQQAPASARLLGQSCCATFCMLQCCSVKSGHEA